MQHYTRVSANEVGDFSVENSILTSVYLRRAELGEHINGLLYFSTYLSEREFNLY
jgi:hypothetical protein